MRLFLCIVLTFLFAVCIAENPIAASGSLVNPLNDGKQKGTFYFSWGYNRDYFSKSDLHFWNAGSDQYDFTLIAMQAQDRPAFDKIFDFKVKPKTYLERMSVPQYSYRLGYYFNNQRDEGIEINFDHTKYVMVRNTVNHLKGTIHGVNYDLDTLITPSFLQFEHTNGGNFLLVNYMRKKKIFALKEDKLKLSGILKGGVGIVIPKTEVSLFGVDLDNRFHVAGWMAGVETGLRLDLFKRFFIEPTVKGNFADYMNVLTVGTGKAQHHFWCFETILVAGVQFPL